MNRRDFVVKLPALFALPLVISQIGCDSTTQSESTDDDNMNDKSFKITSSSNSGHSHTVEILYDDIESPSMMNTLNSSSTNHFHKITISMADYQTLKDGGTVGKTSTTNSGHNHTFSIKVPQ